MPNDKGYLYHGERVIEFRAQSYEPYLSDIEALGAIMDIAEMIDPLTQAEDELAADDDEYARLNGCR